MCAGSAGRYVAGLLALCAPWTCPEGNLMRKNFISVCSRPSASAQMRTVQAPGPATIIVTGLPDATSMIFQQCVCDRRPCVC